jgi:hypothetical protein
MISASSDSPRNSKFVVATERRIQDIIYTYNVRVYTPLRFIMNHPRIPSSRAQDKNEGISDSESPRVEIVRHGRFVNNRRQYN